MTKELRAPVPGGTITGSLAGDGPPVLVLHGGPGMSDYTESLAAELDDAFTVIRYQQRGLAPSVTAGPFTVTQHTADAMAVLEAAGTDRAYVVGHSWGGHFAMHLAVRHPDRVLGLVVVDPLGAVADGGLSEMGQNLLERMRPEATARSQELEERAAAGQGTPDDAIEGLALVWPGYFASVDTAPPMPPLRLSTDCYTGTFASIHEHFEQHTLERSLPELKVPTVFVLGASSPIPTRHGVASADLIPGAECHIEEGCGHFPWLERPGVIRKALDRIGAQHDAVS